VADRLGRRERRALKKKGKKLTTGGSEPPPEDKRFLTWRMARVDFEGEWGWSKLDPAHMQALHRSLIPYEKTPLHVLRLNDRIREIPVAEINPLAQERLVVLEQDDLDYLWELRLAYGGWRVWGILDSSRFDFLWWDPDHTVCRGRDRLRWS
jgi:hypothetical protein